MKKKFAFLSLVAATICCLGLSGCQDEKGKASSNTNQPVAQTQAASAPAATNEVKAEAPKAEVAPAAAPQEPAAPAPVVEKKEDIPNLELAQSPKFREDYTNENLTLPTYEVKGGAPGENMVFERSFENAPPLIPHTLDDMLPITAENNMCTTCHLPEAAQAMQIKSVPQSHLADLRDENQKSLDGALSMARYDCVSCHVIQTNATQLVQNKFEADFSRFADSNTSSNLLDILNQGADIK